VNASRKNVRNFGLLFTAICLLATAYLVFKGQSLWPWTACAAAFFGLSAFAAYPVLKPLYTVWMLFAFALGWVNTRLLLGAFFYLVVTPIGLLLRLTGKDLLDEKIDPSAKSYWIKRKETALEPSRLERLF
jgi:hypothetical protein